MNMDDYMRLSEEVWPIKKNSVFMTRTPNPACPPVADLTHFGALVEREARREAAADIAQALCEDCENGVKWLSEQAAAEFNAQYPHLAAAIRSMSDPIPFAGVPQ